MAQVFKIALPGYNAETDTDPDHFSLYVDQQVDYVLIKEKEERRLSVPPSGVTIEHGLNYVPFCLVFAEVSPGVWQKVYAMPFGGGNVYFTVDATNLSLYNATGSAKNFMYYIFYDNIT